MIPALVFARDLRRLRVLVAYVLSLGAVLALELATVIDPESDTDDPTGASTTAPSPSRHLILLHSDAGDSHSRKAAPRVLPPAPVAPGPWESEESMRKYFDTTARQHFEAGNLDIAAERIIRSMGHRVAQDPDVA